MEEIAYLKLVKNYDDILINNKFKLLKKIIFKFKNQFNIITKKKESSFNFYILPYKENISKLQLMTTNYNNISNKKIEKIIKKHFLNKNIKVVLSNELNKDEYKKILDKYNVKYLNGNLAKKKLIFNTLEYINKIQNKKNIQRDIIVLINESNDIYLNIITRLAFECKSLKIVSNKIYNFKKLEEKLYKENGIAIQFSNSYSKSLKKSEIIINLDFSDLLINEYEINKNAIIINTENKIKIKSKMFNGIIINSLIIKLPPNIEKMKKIKEFNSLLIYESLIETGLEKVNVKILNLIGINGVIGKREFEKQHILC